MKIWDSVYVYLTMTINRTHDLTKQLDTRWNKKERMLYRQKNIFDDFWAKYDMLDDSKLDKLNDKLI